MTTKYDPKVNRFLIERKQLNPKTDPITDIEYLVRTGHTLLCGIVFLGPFSLFYLLLRKIHQLIAKRPPIRE